jgi:multisubunit Na+/H+ antiporter MnhB subunit
VTVSILDSLLVAGILALAWRALFSADLFESIVYFVAFGLAVALAWVRLEAPDVAIAEAAIGAGLTGALLLITWRRLGGHLGSPRPTENLSRTTALVCALGAMLGGLLIWTMLSQPAAPGLAALIGAELHASGVSNPVTAVLLNFRAYDTLLEIGVLFLVVLAIRALGLSLDTPHERLPSSPALSGLLRLTVPLCILAGAYLLWTGAATPGGAFQAGALWAGALVLLHLAGAPPRTVLQARWPSAIGLTVFATAAALCLILGGALLEYPSAHAGIWILAIETAAALSIAATLYSTYAVNLR